MLAAMPQVFLSKRTTPISNETGVACHLTGMTGWGSYSMVRISEKPVTSKISIRSLLAL